MLTFSRDGYNTCLGGDLAEIGRLIETEEWNGALNAIVNAVAQTHMHELLHDHALYYPQLDELVQKIAACRPTTKHTSDRLNLVQLIIGTEFYVTGGHSRIAKTLCTAATNPIVVITDIYNKFSSVEGGAVAIINFFHPYPVIILNNANVFEKLKQLETLIDALHPSAICMLNHFQDPLPLIGALRARSSKKIYYHHCDHNPALGASINVFAHIDTTPCSQEICKANISSDAVYYVPMSDVSVASVNIKFNALETLSTIIAAGAHKLNVTTQNDFDYYPYEVVKLMQATHGFHHHFGALTDEFLQKIRSVLDQHGVAQDKLIYHGTVSSLSAALRLISNPVFVPSFPVGAGLTTIEMCANGVPMLVHEKGREMDGKISKKLISSLIPNSAIRWTRDETLGSMCALMKNNYVKFSELSRSHYIKFYDSALVADGFKKILSE